MALLYEGIVRNGQIQLDSNVKLPESTKVYVVIPGHDVEPILHIHSPKLAHPEQIKDFEKTVIESKSNEGI